MASAELSRRVEKVVGYPPLCEIDADQRRDVSEVFEGDRLHFPDLAMVDPKPAAILGVVGHVDAVVEVSLVDRKRERYD